MSVLVQILLPLTDNDGNEFGWEPYEDVLRELTESFRGATAYTRASAEGRWRIGGEESHDELIVLETLAKTLDRQWWETFRAALEIRFKQDQVLVRAQRVEIL